MRPGKRLFALAFLAGLALVIYIYHPASSVKMMRCPFRLATGLYCPGCGSIRAFTQLARGNLAGAARHNIFALLFSPLLGWLVLSNLKTLILGKALPLPSPPAWAVWGLFGLLLLFTLLRNLPCPWLNFLGP